MSKIGPSNAILSSFTQNKIQINGSITLKINIADVTVLQEFIVTPMLDVDFLLGLNFLQTNNITIEYGSSTLRTKSGGFCALFEKPKDVTRVMRIRCEKTVTVPANTVQFISGKIPATEKNYQGMVEPFNTTMQATGVLMGPSVVYTDKRWLPVRCLNLQDEPLVLYRGSTLGFLKPATLQGNLHDVKMVGHEKQPAPTKMSPPSGKSSSQQEKKSDLWTKKKLFEALKLDEIMVKMTAEERIRLEDVLWQYRSCFAYDKDDFGCCNMYTAHIDLKRDFVPSWTPSRPTPYKLEPVMDEKIENMIATGVVEPLTAESSWNSPIFLVANSTPGSYRVVADMRGVNRQCLEDKFELPNLNHMLDRMTECSIMSTFDMAASFHQIPYDDESKLITAFKYKGRRLNFARMIMGHCSSSSSFTRMLYKLLEFVPIEQLVYFLDDLLLGSKDVASHIDRLEMLLEQLEKANLKLTPAKTALMRTEVKYVGVTLSAEGIRINDERIEAIKKIPAPTSFKETQKVLGFFGYNRKFIRRYSELSRPLYALLQKGKRFEWTTECEEAFQELKVAVSNSPTLCFPQVDDPHDSYEVQLDGSKYGMGAILSQMINGERRIVGYFSKAVPRHKKESIDCYELYKGQETGMRVSRLLYDQRSVDQSDGSID